MTLFRILMVLFVANSASASSFSERAAEFLLATQESMQELSLSGAMQGLGEMQCQPQSSNVECVKYVAGSYPSGSDKQAAALACVGVTSVECVKYVAGSYPSGSDKVAAAKSCRNVPSAECVEYVAGSYPSGSDKVIAAKACMNVEDVECVKYVAGSYPSGSDKVAAAKSCGGQE